MSTPASTPAFLSEDRIRQARVMLVDDDVGIVCSLANMLDRLGYTRVETVSDSRQFRARFEAFKPDIVLTDLVMPEIDGIEIVEMIRAMMPRDSFFPILILTGSHLAEETRRALKAGATEIVHKPFDLSELLMRIRNSLRVHFMHEAIQHHNAELERTVTERTRELQKACAALEQANSALKVSQKEKVEQERFRAFGEMAGGVVHDFNNALMTVTGYSEMLLRDPASLQDTGQVAECLRTILTAARDASHVVSRLREFYRPREAGEQFAPVLMNKLLEEVSTLTQPKWKTQPLAAGRVVNMAFELSRVPPALGNGAELREVVTNLIFNAVDAMPNGGTITLRTRREDMHVVFEVSDTGQGMTPEVRRRCLDPYFSTKGRQGTGLGLSMVFGIIKRHEGVLDIDSAPGKGTTFRIHLPIHADPANGPINGSAAPSVVKPLQVLVVDDDPTSREVLGNFLQADGHKVMVARSGGEAVLQFLQNRFDLVLTDHGMPGMNGTQLAHFIRKNRADQPVFMVTAFDIDDRNPPPGIDLVLHKPLARDQLRRAIADLGHDE